MPSQLLTANQQWTLGSGHSIYIHSAPASLTVQVWRENLIIHSSELSTPAGWSYFSDQHFDSVVIVNGSTSQTVSVEIATGAQARSNILSGLIQVSSIVQGTAITDGAVTVGTSATVLAAAASGRRSLRVQNLGVYPIYLGSATVTMANGIELQPGAVWVERDGAAAAWSGIATANTAARVQEIS